MPSFSRPRLLVSKCLGFAACRYNGEMISDPFTAGLAAWAELRPLCPEMELGLGVPRQPVRLVEEQGRVRLVQPASGRDLTEAMEGLVRRCLEEHPDLDGLLLKSRSPSCGPQDVKIYAANKEGSPSRRGQGMFAGLMLAGRPLLAVEHEGRVRNFHLREHFLTRVFALARLRDLAQRPHLGRLMEFQAANKLLMMAYNQDQMRGMGRLLANPGAASPAEVVAQYRQLLAQALARAPRVGAVINVLMHALGYFKKGLTSREKAYFLDLLEQYRQGRLPLQVLQGLLTAWALKYEVGYLLEQSFFQPYPRELFDLADSGKGRPEA